jgi:hypothetical protein
MAEKLTTFNGLSSNLSHWFSIKLVAMEIVFDFELLEEK